MSLKTTQHYPETVGNKMSVDMKFLRKSTARSFEELCFEAFKNSITGDKSTAGDFENAARQEIRAELSTDLRMQDVSTL